ncbi:MAG TPA: hypothetical protein VGF69_16960 [Thermoanaerobaculia bacterium]|jgi:hypothetical protein
MKTRNAVIDVNPTVVCISLTVLDHGLTLSDPNVRIRWDFQGIVRWTIVGPDHATFHPTEGVKFTAGDAPFAPYAVSPTVWEMDVRNTNPGEVRIPFKYTLKLADGGQPIIDDPTVENDSPPEPVHTPRRFRRTRRIARTRV